ncbi:MAG: LysM peptidoglycan-binding domain-containing protein [Prochlorothrix sp.]
MTTEHRHSSAKLEATSLIPAQTSRNGKSGLVIPEDQGRSVAAANAVAPRTRRARTSAAMVGLAALSMGAADLSSFWNIKGALAADDAVATEPLRRFSENDPEPSSPSVTSVASQTIAPQFVEPIVEPQERFSAGLASGPNASALALSSSEAAWFGTESKITHVVVAGETWETIAQGYGISTQALALANALPLDSGLSPGQILRIPAVVDVATPTAQIFTDVPVAGYAAAEASLPIAFIPETGTEDTSTGLDVTGDPTLLKGDLEGLKAESSSKTVALGSAAPTLAPEPSQVLAAVPPASAGTAWELADLIPYRVQPGDTLEKIARDHSVPRTALMEVNNLQNPNMLVVNQLLGIPRTGDVELMASALGLPEFGETYAVSTEESRSTALALAEVAPGQNPETRVAALVEPAVPSPEETIARLGAPTAAAVEPTTLPIVPIAGVESPEVPLVVASVAQPAAPVISVPGVVSGNGSLGRSGGIYAVQPGDTLFKIARSHGIPVQELANHNQIYDPNHIFVNQQLNIPGAAPQLATPVSTPTTVATTTLNPGLGYDLTPRITPESTPAVTPSLPGTRPQDSQTQDPQVSPHIQSLLGEIEALRAKYRTESEVRATSTAAPAAVPAAATMAATVATPTLAPPPVSASAPVSPAATLATPAVTAPAPGMVATPTVQPAATPEETVALLPVSDRVNPEFRGPSTVTPAAEVSLLDPLQTQTPEPVTAPVSAEEQLLAAAPIGAENYDPLVQSLLGQQVSPQLPAVGADPFLPDEVANGFIWPAQGMLTSGYGWRWGRMHKGIDIAAPVGTPIVAASNGVVTFAGWNSGGYGNLVEIQHPDGTVTLYAHNSRILVRPGQRVGQGQQIAEMGSTGYSTGPHLHFEIHPSGQGAVNPMAYLPR